jgi:hypothetical protein
MNWREQLKTPPSWRALRMMNVALLVLCGGMALIENNWWIMMFDAFVAGSCASGIFHSSKMIRVMESFDHIKEGFDSMCNINKALVEGQVQVRVVMQRVVADDDDDIAPIAPNRLN